VHPDARGEVKIAAAVSDALARLGIGTAYPRPLPAVPLGPRSAATVAATPGDGVADLTWTDPPGADSERVWLRDVTAGAAAEMVSQATGSATRLTGLRNGHTYEVTLQPVKGFVPAEADVRSVAVRVTPSQAVPAAPGGVVGQTASHGARLSWRADPLATSYTVWWRNLSARTGWQTLTTTSTTAWLSGLEAGARHELRVAGVNSSGASGELSPSVLVTPTGPRPTAPRSLRARTSRGGLATLRWTRSTSATHYVVLRRDVTHRGPWQAVRTERSVTGSVLRVGGLRRGTVYAFAVRAMHQRVVGGTSSPVRVRGR
jgi:hypothetical protein